MTFPHRKKWRSVCVTAPGYGSNVGRRKCRRTEGRQGVVKQSPVEKMWLITVLLTGQQKHRRVAPNQQDFNHRRKSLSTAWRFLKASWPFCLSEDWILWRGIYSPRMKRTLIIITFPYRAFLQQTRGHKAQLTSLENIWVVMKKIAFLLLKDFIHFKTSKGFLHGSTTWQEITWLNGLMD